MKTLKDLLRPKETAVIGQEISVHIETVRRPVPGVRDTVGDLTPLMESIEEQGLRHPIAIWGNGQLISGERRLQAYFHLAAQPGKSNYRKIRAVPVATVEEAAKRLISDNADEMCATAMKPSEICRLWELMRELDAPAAAVRLTEARRRGVELRKQTLNGQRNPGRNPARNRGDEYLLSVLGEPFGYSEASASRLWTVYSISRNPSLPDERRNEALKGLAAVDEGRCSIWAAYSALVKGRKVITTQPKAVAPAAPVAAARQSAAWSRSLPQLEGLITGLAELGPPNSDLTWDQVGPVHARLMKARRDLDKIIKDMKETAQS